MSDDEGNTFLIHVLQRIGTLKSQRDKPYRTTVAMITIPLHGDPEIQRYRAANPNADAPPVWFVRDHVLDRPLFYFVPAPEQWAVPFTPGDARTHIGKYAQKARRYAEPDAPRQYQAVMGESAFYGAIPIYDMLKSLPATNADELTRGQMVCVRGWGTANIVHLHRTVQKLTAHQIVLNDYTVRYRRRDLRSMGGDSYGGSTLSAVCQVTRQPI